MEIGLRCRRPEGRNDWQSDERGKDFDSADIFLCATVVASVAGKEGGRVTYDEEMYYPEMDSE